MNKHLRTTSPMRSFEDVLAGLPGILTRSEVAALFQVHPKTVARWDKVLRPIRTPTGHHRYSKQVLAEFLTHSASPRTRPASRKAA